MTQWKLVPVEPTPLRDKLLLAISEVHSGNGAEGERIVDAVLSVLAHLAEDEAVVERLARAMIAEDMKDRPNADLDHIWNTESLAWLGSAQAALSTLAGKE